MRPTIFALIGKTGSGKSSAGREVSEINGWTFISTGDIARKMEAEMGTFSMSDGSFAPEHEMRKRTKQAIRDGGSIIVLDGMPRSMGQAAFLENLGDVFYIHVDVPDYVVIQRLMQRGRLDDTLEAIPARLRHFREVTLPVLDVIRADAIRTIDGNLPEETVVAVMSDIANTVIKERE